MALLHVNTGSQRDFDSENFSVARIKRNIGQESTLGVIYTRRSALNGDETLPDTQARQTLGTDMELGTSTFLENKNLQFQAFFVFHNSPFTGDEDTNLGDRSSRGVRLNFPNQPWFGHISYRELGEAFDPAVGFTPRNSFRRLNPSISYSPQFPKSNLIRQISWNIWFEHLMDLDSTLLTQDVRFTLFDISFMRDEQLSFSLTRNFERLNEIFDIRRDGTIFIPADEYINWYLNASFQTASYRKVSIELAAQAGGFWSGNRTQYSTEVTLRPYPGIELSPEYIRTNIDLEEGNFSAELYRFATNLDFTTSLFFTSILQFDNLSNLLAINNRIRWIITPGPDMFLVYNHNCLEEASRFQTLQRSGTFKLSYTHRF